jgi:hypothetical protein
LFGSSRWKNNFFVCIHANWLAIGFSVSIVNVTLVLSVVCNSDKFLNFPYHKSCLLLVVCIYLSVCAHLVCVSKSLLLDYVLP